MLRVFLESRTHHDYSTFQPASRSLNKQIAINGLTRVRLILYASKCVYAQICKDVIFLKLKVGYFPFLDMVLAFRQVYSVERFKPFNGSLENIARKLTADEEKFVEEYGDITGGWLDAISNLIPRVLEGSAGPEETIMALKNNPGILLDPKKRSTAIGKNPADDLLSLWQHYFLPEISRNSGSLFNKALELSTVVEREGLLNYLLSITDRISIEDNTLSFKIKPEHSVKLDELGTVILMPSLFASRNFTFWYNGNDYLIFISLNSREHRDKEPSDMLLLKTLAFNDRTRLKMLRLLRSSSYTVSAMAEKLGLNVSTVSRHFKVFKDAGYVDILSQEGNSIHYSLNIKEVESATKAIINYIKEGKM